MQLIQTPLSLLQTTTFLKPKTPTLTLTTTKPKTQLKTAAAYKLKPGQVYSVRERLEMEEEEETEPPLTKEEELMKLWTEDGWAPWEDIASPEAAFAIHAMEEGNPISGEPVPLKNPETVEAFNMLKPAYVEKKVRDAVNSGLDWHNQQFVIKGEILPPLVTEYEKPVVVTHVAPRDWPPPGWEVDRKELEFIREAHGKMNERVDLDGIEDRCVSEEDGFALDRYKVFLGQYNDWVVANKDRLEKEAYKYDQDFYPGRRKRGKDYKEGMYELPFFYPGQLCHGKVTAMHLHQGAFVDIGGVYDGHRQSGFRLLKEETRKRPKWVPIKGNDWYWIRQYIKLGLHVIVEITAKRDPYRYRFPLELRFVDPNIDHLIFNRFDYPPIFHRGEDTNPDDTLRECGRPPTLRTDSGIKVEEQPLKSEHPYVDTLWQINAAEQMILDDIEANPEKYEGKKLSELKDEEEFDEKHSVEFTKEYLENKLVPKTILKTSVKDLDLEAAFAERQENKRLNKEVDKLRRHREMDEYDFLHWRRSFEEREALLRDISSRQALGLPIQEPDRYVEEDDEDYEYRGLKFSRPSKKQSKIKGHNESLSESEDEELELCEIPYDDDIRIQELRKLQETNFDEELPYDRFEDELEDGIASWASIKFDDLVNVVEGESEETLQTVISADAYANLLEGVSEWGTADITADDISKLIERVYGVKIGTDSIDRFLDGRFAVPPVFAYLDKHLGNDLHKGDITDTA